MVYVSRIIFLLLRMLFDVFLEILFEYPRIPYVYISLVQLSPVETKKAALLSDSLFYRVIDITDYS
jgi:hypothetical protein